MNPMMMTQGLTGTFMGPEVKGSMVTLSKEGATTTLTLSDDFVVPGAPAPHWQVVDSMGQTFLLRRLVTADGKFHGSIQLPMMVKDVAKVQIYCAFAEVVLGEATLA
jgi:hypothetical protein